MSEAAASVVYDEETGLFRVETTAGESRTGLSKAEAQSLCEAVNRGALQPAQLGDVPARSYVQAGQSRNWDDTTPAGTPAQKG